MASWTKHADSWLKCDILLDPKKANALRLYDYLLLSAFKRPGRKDGVEIPRGAVPKTEKQLYETLSLTRKEFRVALAALLSANKIAVTKHTGFTVFSVIDYDCDFQKSSKNKLHVQSSPQNGEKTNSSSDASMQSVIDYDCEYNTGPQKGPQKGPRKNVKNSQCFQGLRDSDEEQKGHEKGHVWGHKKGHEKETEKSKEEEKEKRTKKEKEEEKKKDKEKYCGGGGGGVFIARSREDLDDEENAAAVDSVIEAACSFGELKKVFSGLPVDTQFKFRQTADTLFQRFFGRIPSHFDCLSLFSMLCWSLYGDGEFFRLSDDDVELLTLAFKAAADAGHSDLAYLHGVFRRFRQRGIRTPSDFYAFELSRAGIL